ncbi:hypothetical protein [Novosphingobium lindaniclasticum]
MRKIDAQRWRGWPALSGKSRQHEKAEKNQDDRGCGENADQRMG